MAAPDLEKIAESVKQSIDPRIKNLEDLTKSFRRAADSHNENVQNVIKDVYNNIFSQKSDISSIDQSVNNLSVSLQGVNKRVDESSFYSRQTMQLQYQLQRDLEILRSELRGFVKEQSSFNKRFYRRYRRDISKQDTFLEKLEKRAIANNLIAPDTRRFTLKGKASVAAGALGIAAAGKALYDNAGRIKDAASPPDPSERGTPGPDDPDRAPQGRAPEDDGTPKPSAPQTPSPGAPPGPSSGSTPESNEKPKPGYSGRLANDRKRFAKELEDDPKLLRDLYNRTYNEDSKNSANFVEATGNRAMLQKKSLRKVLDEMFDPSTGRGYFPRVSFRDRNPSQKQLEKFKEEILAEFFKGRNVTRMATDNASDAPGNPVASRREAAGVTGRRFGATRNSRGELYYHGGSKAGRYRTAHGVAAEKYQAELDEEEKQKKQGDARPRSTSPRTEETPEPPRERSPKEPDATRTYPEDLDTLPKSVRDLRIKDSRGRTITLGEIKGLEKFSDLAEKGGQAFRGGRFGRYNDPNVTYMAGEIQSILGERFGRITAQNDAFHHGPYAKDYLSPHTKGVKLDFTVTGEKGKPASLKDYNDQVNKLTKEFKEKYGLIEGKHYKIVRNYDHGSARHIDIGFTKEGTKIIEEYRKKEIEKNRKKPEDKQDSPRPPNEQLQQEQKPQRPQQPQQKPIEPGEDDKQPKGDLAPQQQRVGELLPTPASMVPGAMPVPKPEPKPEIEQKEIPPDQLQQVANAGPQTQSQTAEPQGPSRYDSLNYQNDDFYNTNFAENLGLGSWPWNPKEKEQVGYSLFS